MYSFNSTNYFSELLLFYELAQGSTYADLSEKYFISASSLSKSIKRLEEGMEVVLFDRSVRPMRLTPDGVRMRGYLDRIVPVYQEMCRAFQKGPVELRYQLLLSLDEIPVRSLLTTERPITEETYRVYHVPEPILLPSQVEEALTDGALDFAILHDTAYLSQAVRREFLYDDTVLLVLPKEHPLAQEETVSVQQLAGYSFAGSRDTRAILEELEHTHRMRFGFISSGTHRYKTRLAVMSNQALSLTYASEYIAVNWEAYGLCCRPIREYASVPVVFAYRPGSQHEEQIIHLLYKLKKHLEKVPPTLK